MKKSISTVVCVGLLWAGAAQAGGTPQQKCQGAKNQTVGKYAACRFKAAAKLAVKSDMTAYSAALAKCDSKYTGKWPSLEQAALDAGSSCPSTGDQTSIQDFTTACTDAVATELGGGSLPLDVATCNTNLGTCNTNYTTCSGSLMTCNGGTAGLGDVLSGKTFSSNAGLGVSGTMPNNGAADFTPGAAAVPVPAGYYSGGQVNTDGNLVAGNIKTGTSIFGVAGNVVPLTESCGNNRSEGSEVCDGADLDGQTCATQAPATPYGTLACSGCAFDTSGCTAARFVDNGNGTVTDNQTKLVWEKKDTTCPGTHCYTSTYTWASSGTTPNGTAFTGLLGTLNGGTSSDGTDTPTPCFTGHCDWRLPTIQELQGIVDLSATGCGGGSPCIDPAFGTTQSGGYWSATTYAGFPGGAWGVDFLGGVVTGNGKTGNGYVRAVRGGL